MKRAVVGTMAALTVLTFILALSLSSLWWGLTAALLSLITMMVFEAM